MLRDNLVGLIEPMLISAGADPLALSIQKRASDDRPSCLENPRPQGAESSLTENVTSPFQAEPAQRDTALPIAELSCACDFLKLSASVTPCTCSALILQHIISNLAFENRCDVS